MSNSSSQQKQQVSIQDSASISGSQIAGQAGRDSIQNDGSGSILKDAGRDINQYQAGGNLFKDVTIQMFGASDASASAPPAKLSRKDYRNRAALLNKVRSYWIEGVLETSLHHRAPLELGLEARDDALLHPWDLEIEHAESAPESLPADVSAADIFDQMGAGRTLLLLGEPGSGKTTTLLELARNALVRAGQDPSSLIPVVFNLSSWQGEKQSIDDWLVAELNAKYQVPQPVGRAWVKQEVLLLLLDGLDEVRPAWREDCVKALNQFHRSHCPEIVVCSRIEEYEALSNRLSFQTALYLRSLAPEQIHSYLNRAGADLAALSSLLERDPALQELAKSPLMLNTMMMAYQGMPLEALPQVEQLEDCRAQIFNAYIDRMFKRRGTGKAEARSQILAYLHWLAREMAQFSPTIFLIEALQPAWLRTPWQRRIYEMGYRVLMWALWGSIHVGLLAGHDPIQPAFNWLEGLQGLALGLLGGALCGLLRGVASPLHRDWRGWLVNALIPACIFGPIFGWLYGSWLGGVAYSAVYGVAGILAYGLTRSNIDPVDRLTWSWRKFRNNLPWGAVVGLVLFLGGTLGDTTSALIFSLIFGLDVAFAFSFDKRDEVDRNTQPNQGIWNSASNTRVLLLSIGLLTGIVLGIAQDPTFGIVNGLIFAMLAGLIGGQGSGIVCLKHLTLRWLLWRDGAMPWNYAQFLNRACDRILLQKVGGGYVFTHRLLLEHFAQLPVVPSRKQ